MPNNCNIYLPFGENIKLIRERNNITLKEMASRVGYNRNSLSKLEYGVQDVKLSTAIRLAKKLNISFISLMSRTFYDDVERDITPVFIPDDFLRVFNENARKALKEKGMQEYQLYMNTGIDVTTISRIFNLKADPKLSTLNQISIALSTDLKELFIRK